jgi:hypothetical protein
MPITITTLDAYLSEILAKDVLDERVLYRGQQDASWKLTPQIDRPAFKGYREEKGWPREMHEENILREFRKGVRPFISMASLPPWEELALAQHHGLATRLLDWTSNPLVGLYFAVEAPGSSAAAVWEYRCSAILGTDLPVRPSEVTEVLALDPPHISPRISAQSARFTVHPDESELADEAGVRQFVVPAEYRHEFKRQLVKMGIMRQSLFPDLDGLATHANWLYSRLF